MERLIHSRFNVTRGVWRLRGSDRSIILKVVGPLPGGATDPDDRTGIHDRRREVEILDGGLPVAYRTAGIRGPALLRRIDRPATSQTAMFLEDVTGRPGADWSLAEFGVAARRLGRAQGRMALDGAGETPPGWASRSFLRRYLENVERRERWSVIDDPAAWRAAATVGFEGPGLRDAANRLRASRVELLAFVEVGPRTICHLDVWPSNLFAGTDETIMIDWAFAGVGGLGEDLGNLVPDSVFDLILPSGVLAELDRTLFDAYAAGLRDSGWDGDLRRVRLTMCAAAVKYGWVGAASLRNAGQAVQTGYGGQLLADPRRYYSERAAVVRFLGDWASEALRLSAELR